MSVDYRFVGLGDVPLLDQQVLADFDETMRGIVFPMFFDEEASVMQRLRMPAAAGDFELLRKHIHSLIGSAGAVGAARLVAAYKRLQVKARARDGSELEPIFLDIQLAYHQTVLAMQAL